ncbi:hypothetical protein [Bacillus cereus]|uniref:hypothetical protein n=2 Tax=Bacillus cereus group TaxID=86661 RepID=UPI001F5DE121|nr:hypothetical protein [Bacillus cereus]
MHQNQKNIHNYKLNELNEGIVVLRNEQNELHEMLLSQEAVAASIEGAGDDMEELKKKVYEMDKKITLIEERAKKLESVPSGLEMKQIISDVIDSKNLVSVDKLELEIIKSRNTQVLWTIGTIISIVSLGVAVIKLL